MTENDWLTAEETKMLRAQGAPLKLVKALGSYPRMRHSLLAFDFTERYGVFVDIVQRRSKKLAQGAVFETVEALTLYLGDPRSVPNFTGDQILCREWRCVPGWALSVSAELYSGDTGWCDTAIIMHRRFQDEASQSLMDRQVKIALWGEEEEGWPQPRYFSPPPIVIHEPAPLPDWVVELEQLGERPPPQPAVELDGNKGTPSLDDLFLD